MIRTSCLISILAATIIASPQSIAKEFGGTVIKVLSADTLNILSATTIVRIKLADIDAPDHGQPFAALILLTLSLTTHTYAQPNLVAHFPLTTQIIRLQ